MIKSRAPIDKEKLWRRFLQDKHAPSRSRLIMAYDNLVRTIAATMFAKRYGNDVEFDDFYQMGMLGLIQSVDRFEPDKGAAFETFATYRIRGSILNGLEEQSEQSSQSGFRVRRANARLTSIVKTQDAKPQSAFEEMVELTLGLAIGFILEDTGLVRGSSEINEDASYETNQLFQLREILEASILNLPERERKIVQFHYFHKMNFGVVAEILGVTKGRVSQLHKRALQRLHQSLGTNKAGLDTYL